MRAIGVIISRPRRVLLVVSEPAGHAVVCLGFPHTVQMVVEVDIVLCAAKWRRWARL